MYWVTQAVSGLVLGAIILLASWGAMGHDPDQDTIKSLQQDLYECQYKRDECGRADARDIAYRESCEISLGDTRQMLETCKLVLEISDANACHPYPEPTPQPIARKKRHR